MLHLIVRSPKNAATWLIFANGTWTSQIVRTYSILCSRTRVCAVNSTRCPVTCYSTIRKSKKTPIEVMMLGDCKIEFRRSWENLHISYASEEHIDWNPEYEFTSDDPPNGIPWRAYGSGLNYGLTLALDVAADEYYCSSSASVGFKVYFYAN